MTNPELIERVRELRQRGRTPKEIARALSLPPAAVAPLIRAVAAAQPKRGAQLVGCWVNQGWAAGLTVAGHAEWPGAGATAEPGKSGLVSILAARDGGGSVSVCGYLVDVWCLGVKNALGPKSVERRKLPGFTDWYFRSYDQPPLAVPIDLARHVVFGAVAYARASSASSRTRTSPDARAISVPGKDAAISPSVSSYSTASRCTSRDPTTMSFRSCGPCAVPLATATTTT